MYIEPKEKKQLLGGYKVILVIWWAIFASLFIYLIVCRAIGDQLQNVDKANIPVDMIKYALWGVSISTLVAAHFLRRFLLRTRSTGLGSISSTAVQHPAVARYTVAIIITMALLESIGIYGVVMFFIAQDAPSLYQLLIISALAMIFYRPRKEELLKLAVQMKK